jgi:hypothetical protein
VLPWEVRFRQLEMRSEFGSKRIMPNSGKGPEATKRVAGENVKTRSVVMPNWKGKALISRGLAGGRPSGSPPQYSALDSGRRWTGRGEKWRPEHPFRPEVKSCDTP